MEFVLDNVVGTANILDYARDSNEEKVLYERLVYFKPMKSFGPAPKGIDYKVS